MNKTKQNGCRCRNASCGCEGVKPSRCSCGERCDCKPTCHCASGCSCPATK